MKYEHLKYYINLTELLNKFAQEVKNNKYKKLDYTTFRELSRAGRNNIKYCVRLVILEDGKRCCVQLYDDIQEIQLYWDYYNNNCFSEFLFNEVVLKHSDFFKEPLKEMGLYTEDLEKKYVTLDNGIDDPITMYLNKEDMIDQLGIGE